MSSYALRTSLRRAASLRRSTSSQASSSSQSTLPPEKMRALISLYHQAQGFVTPETLDAAIDHAFIHVFSNGGIMNNHVVEEMSFYDLKEHLGERQLLPKIGSGKDISMPGSSRSRGWGAELWSESKTSREEKVLGALYGIEGRGQPGLEVLEEESERIQGHLEADRQS